MITITASNQKGGVAKSTTIAHLAYGLGEQDKRVLAVDLDPQGNLTDFLGASSESLESTVYNALFEDGVGVNDVVIGEQKPNVDLVPANIDLAGAETLLMNEMARESAVRSLLGSLTDYDYVLIDCQPSLGLLPINAMVASDFVLVPVECAYPSLRGLKQLLATIDKVTGKLNPELAMLGILLTQHDKRTLHAREVIDRVREHFGERVFQSVIPRRVAFDEATIRGQTLMEYDPSSDGTAAYRALTEEVLNGTQK